MNTAAQPLRWGIAGPGRIVVQSIAPALQAMPGSTMVACVASSPEKGRAFADKFGLARVHADIEAMAADPEVDAVYIATPNGNHHREVIACAKGGKHVLCEKPLALSAVEGREMVAACRRAGVVLCIAHQMRFEAILVRAREIVQSGRLGELRAISFERGAPMGPKPAWRHEIAQGGIFYDVGIHLLDYVQWMTGARVAEVAAFSHPDRRLGVTDDTIAILANLSNGCQAMVRATREVPFTESNLEVQGSKGMLTTSALRFSDEFVLRIREEGGTTEERFPASPAYRLELEAFEREVRGERTALPDGADGARMSGVMAAVAEAVEQRRVVATP